MTGRQLILIDASELPKLGVTDFTHIRVSIISYTVKCLFGIHFLVVISNKQIRLYLAFKAESLNAVALVSDKCM